MSNTGSVSPRANARRGCRALGQAMNEHREQAGLSVADPAWFVGVSPWTMRRFLRDASWLSVGDLNNVALALQVSPLALLGRAGEIAGDSAAL